jgi:DNA modification methylase
MLVSVPRNTVMQGHVLDQLRELPNDCVDIVVTSTPYYGLRDYGPDCISIWDGDANCEHIWEPYSFSLHNGRGDAQKSAKFSEQNSIPDLELSNANCVKCGAWKGQLGLEPHPSLFIEHLAQVFFEIKRVLKPSGSLWLNLGDTYFGGNGQYGRPKDWKDLENDKLSGHAPGDFIKERNKLRSNWLQPKQKMLIPARVAIALQEQGWILRNEVVWHKVNHMPESCRDRLTRSWESVYFFSKAPSYYFDLNAIRQKYTSSTYQRLSQDLDNIGAQVKARSLGENLPVQSLSGNGNQSFKILQSMAKKLTKSEGLSYAYNGKHSGCLNEDGTLRGNPQGANPGDVWSLTNEGINEEHFAAFPQKLVKRILQCSAPKGGLVLDPFAGAGTSLLVAHKMGFDWLGIELVPKYCKIIEKRIERHGRVRLDGFMPFNSSEKNGAANE